MIRGLLVVALVALVAGCTSPSADPATGSPSDIAAATPVDIDESLDLAQGAQDSWQFTVAPNATHVEIRFTATGPAAQAPGAGLPTCVTINTPDGEYFAGTCQGGTGNIQISPYFVLEERVFYAKGQDATPGNYVIGLNAQPSATMFHAFAKVSYS